MKRLSRVLVALLVAALVSLGLTAVSTSPAGAEVETFFPPKARKYFKNVKITAGKKNWLFEVRTKNPKNIKGFQVYIDDGEAEHTHLGAEYLIKYDEGEFTLYYFPEDALYPRVAQDCPKLATGKLADGQAGRFFRVPQRCLVIKDYNGTLNRLRVRVNVWAVVPDGGSGKKEGSWSPAAGPYKFHKYVANAPEAIEQFRY